MRVVYFTLELLSGAGQTNRLLELLRYGRNRWESEIVTRSIDAATLKQIDEIPVRLTGQLRGLLNRKVIETHSSKSVLHIQSGFGYYLLAIKSRLPTVYTLQQADPPYLFRGTDRVGRLLARGLERPPFLRPEVRYVSIAPWVREWYRTEYGIDSEVISDTVDLSRFSPPGSASPQRARNEEDAKQPRLLMVGNWDGEYGRKRHHEVIQLLPEFLAEFPRASLTLCGLSQDSISRLGQVVRALGVGESVKFLGHLSEEGLVKALRQADVFVTGTISEGFYRPIVEAFACGLPAAVRDASALANDGCLAPLHHVKQSGAGESFTLERGSLANAVGLIMQSWHTYSTKAIHYSQLFDSRQILPRYSTLYESLIG